MAFTRFTKNVLNVSALPDRVQNQAQTLKATFDQAGVDIKAALNALIVELEASTSADNIGADVQSVATKTVQAILTAFEEAIADRYTKTEADALIATGTNDLVADIDVNLTTGVITITKKDGTVETFDTAIEKVPAKFEVVESGDTFALKITNVDGTSTQTDITNFMNIYNFNNSDNITFEVTGEGAEKTVTANIKANSIGLDKLSLSIVSTLEGYMNSAKDSATAAKTSETNARTSELNALEAKNTAVTKAQEASASASAAKTSETNAEYWAKQAQQGGGGGGGITEIPVATADTLGGIKVGEGLEITEDGILSALGGGNGENVSKVEIGNLDYTNSSTNEAASTATLTDNIENYDFLTVDVSAITTANDPRTLSPLIIRVPSLVEKGYYSPTNKNLFHGMSGFLSGSTQHSVRVTLGFESGTYLSLVSAIPSAYKTAKLGKVYGIKLGAPIILDGAKDVDLMPTEGSKNVVTSGGVKTYVDERSVRIIEASTTNVIDFNTLTEPGIYLVKNCSDAAGTTLNTPYPSDIRTIDIILEVTDTKTVESGDTFQIRQHITYGNHATKETRAFTPSTSVWTEWSDAIQAGSKSTADVSKALVRNIKASTTDLTAGTSALTSGTVYLVYE